MSVNSWPNIRKFSSEYNYNEEILKYSMIFTATYLIDDACILYIGDGLATSCTL